MFLYFSRLFKQKKKKWIIKKVLFNTTRLLMHSLVNSTPFSKSNRDILWSYIGTYLSILWYTGLPPIVTPSYCSHTCQCPPSRWLCKCSWRNAIKHTYKLSYTFKTFFIIVFGLALSLIAWHCRITLIYVIFISQGFLNVSYKCFHVKVRNLNTWFLLIIYEWHIRI